MKKMAAAARSTELDDYLAHGIELRPASAVATDMKAIRGENEKVHFNIYFSYKNVQNRVQVAYLDGEYFLYAVSAGIIWETG
ncbi:MAG: hypothetical protein ACK4UN_17125, partial [Limisphaerales bacterium]